MNLQSTHIRTSSPAARTAMFNGGLRACFECSSTDLGTASNTASDTALSTLPTGFEHSVECSFEPGFEPGIKHHAPPPTTQTARSSSKHDRQKRH